MVSIAELVAARKARVDEDLSGVLARMQRAAVLSVRLEGMERVHAVHGQAADALVSACGAALKQVCRPSDTVARHGSGFVVLAARVHTLRAGQGIAGRLLRCLDGPILDGAHPIQPVVGICFFPTDADGPAEAIRKAELAALHAAASRQQVSFYEPTFDADAADLAALRRELVQAVRGGAIEVVYQPQFDLVTGDLSGAEALARYHSARQGPVSPGRFVPLLEALGKVAELTDAVLRTAARDVATWDDQAPEGFRVSVNLSGAELRTGRATELLALLEEAGAPARRFTFEITESVWMQAMDEALEELALLRQAGAHLALDDFGSGYSSLGYLARLPVHTVKIDRCFVQDLGQRHVRTLLEGVVTMVHALGLHVLVEGVETPSQLDVVQAIGCDTVQGYLTGRPGPASELARQFRPARTRPGGPGGPARARTTDPAEPLPPLPLLPSVIHHLCRWRADGTDPEALVACAAADPCLSLFVFQLCRAGPRPPERLTAVSQAVLRVGARQVVDRVLGSSTGRVFLPTPATASLWTHAIEVACWAAAIATTSAPAISPERAYAAGLLHDIGRFPMLENQAAETLEVQASGWSSPAELIDAEKRVMEADHTTIGGVLLRARNLPDDLTAVVELHHGPLGAVPAEHRDLVALVKAADVLAMLQARHPEYRGSSPVARAARMRRAVASLRTPWALDMDALSALWGDVVDESQRRVDFLGM